METVKKNLYEGMFLIDSALAAADWDAALKSITDILEKSGAAIESVRKWDERMLAYSVNGKNRGTYILTYFRVEGPKIQEIERNTRLSEKIMRVLILSTERMTQEDIDKALNPQEESREPEKVGAAESSEE